MEVDDAEAIDLIPDIKCGEATNGIIPITIRNSEAFYELEPYYDWHDICLKLTYRSVSSANSNNTNTCHPHIDNFWRQKYVLFANLPDHDKGKLYLQTTVHLNAYNLEVKFSAKNKQTNKWMSETDTFTINIPSFLQDNTFKIGEEVSFRDIKSSYTSYGIIEKKLKDDQYRIIKINGEKEQDYYDVDICRLYHTAIDKLFQVNLRHTDLMDKNLFIMRNDDSINVFKALQTVFEDISIDMGVQTYGIINATIHWEAISDFLSTNIFDYLYGKQFKYIVSCLLNDKQHKCLEMINIRQHDIEIKYEAIKKKQISNYYNHDIVWSCDWCRCEFSEWEYGFRCKGAVFEDRHEFCMNCINTVIMLNGELMNLLCDLLSDYLINDCVEVIVHFVIGKVIYKQFSNCNQEKVEVCNNKRKCDFDIPLPKRLRLK
eukprot:290696_1